MWAGRRKVVEENGTGDRAAKTEAERSGSSGLPRKTEWSAVASRASLRAYFDDLAIADCLATMRSRMARIFSNASEPVPFTRMCWQWTCGGVTNSALCAA